MSHKGYTLNYFIALFESIPDHQWCVGEFQNEGTVQHCALGHARRNLRTTLEKTSSESWARSVALGDFFGSEDLVTEINDNEDGEYTSLGKTPRGRILRALRNRQRTGNIWGDVDNSSSEE